VRICQTARANAIESLMNRVWQFGASRTAGKNDKNVDGFACDFSGSALEHDRAFVDRTHQPSLTYVTTNASRQRSLGALRCGVSSERELTNKESMAG